MSRRNTFCLLLLFVLFIPACNFPASSSPIVSPAPLTKEIRILQTMPAVSPTTTPLVISPTPVIARSVLTTWQSHSTIKAGQQIVVVLSEQKTYAYEDGVLLKEFLVSTGVAAYPTVLGTYAIYIKLDSTRMTGPDYDLANVPWTMYFYQGYGFHGTYWHNNFGTPMSHGCVNMRIENADWLYHWASVGTSVLVLP